MCFRKVEKTCFPRLGTVAFPGGKAGPHSIHFLGITGGTLQVTEYLPGGNSTEKEPPER